jgi:hypothetical protein
VGGLPMPLYKTAQRGSHLRPKLDDYYVFPEVHKGNWAKFYESMDGDQEKILSWADKSGIEHPKAWFESLHRFLFDIYTGTPAMLKKAAKENFGSFLKEIHSNHMKNPKPDRWYHAQGITPRRFMEVMRDAAEIKQTDQAIAFINARVMNLGFYLYSEFILSKTDEGKKLKSVASQKNKEAYDLECLALGKSPLCKLREGDIVEHSLCPQEKLAIEKIVWDDPDHSSLSVVMARNEKKTPFIIVDIWNLTPKI